ncbi:MAG: hypothetical protein PHP96_03420 [Candidatus Dojkabacteria bacterium]|nr:hypothetical protein [Candidatus Dojkabacteria bacterium]
MSKLLTHETVVGVLTKNRNIVPMTGFTLVNNIWHYKGKPLPFVKKYPGTYFFAGVPFEIIQFDMNLIKNPVYNQYCQKLIKLGYHNMDELEDAILFSMMPEDDLRVKEIMERIGAKTYAEASKRINPANLNIKSKILQPFFSSITLQEIVGYGSDIPSENIMGEVDDIYEANKPSNAAFKKIKEMLPWCIILIAGSGAMVLLYVIFVK